MSVDVCGPPPPGYSIRSDDCDDGAAEINPAATEQCDELDNNCNRQIDEGLAAYSFFRDGDGDGRGDPDVSLLDCAAPDGYVEVGDDCDDADPDNYSQDTLFDAKHPMPAHGGRVNVLFGDLHAKSYRRFTPAEMTHFYDVPGMPFQ